MSRKGCLVYIIALLFIVGLLLISSGFLANLGVGTLLAEPVLPTILLPMFHRIKT